MTKRQIAKGKVKVIWTKSFGVDVNLGSKRAVHSLRINWIRKIRPMQSVA